MKSNHFNLSLLSSVKYIALLLAFAAGYKIAEHDYPQTTAILGWVVGFVVGLKLHLIFSRKHQS